MTLVRRRRSAPPEDQLSRLRRELRRERNKLQALEDIGTALGSTFELNELLSLIVNRISQAMEAERSTLYLIDDRTGELWSKVAEGEHIAEIRLPPGEGLAGWVAKTGKPLNVRDAYDDARFDRAWDQRTGFRTRSILGIPLKNQHGRTIGVVQVLNKTEGYFSHEDEVLLAALASQAAVSIENSKLFLSMVTKNAALLETQERLEKKIREQDILFEIAMVTASASKLDDLLEGVLARAMQAVDVEAASILLADAETGDLRFRAAMGGEAEAAKRLSIPAGEGICGWVARQGEAQVVNDVNLDPRHSRSISDDVGYHPRSVLCVPLRWDDGVGALELLNKAGGEVDFNDDDLKLALMIANHVSTAIGLAQIRERRAREERLSIIGQFLSSVLHDLKTPMTVVSGFTQMMVEEPEEERRRAYSQTVLRQVNLINTMTKETLAFARGDRQLWPRRVYLHKFFEELAEQLNHGLHERGIRIELNLRDRGVAVFDEHKIERAVHNLARNAAEAIGEKGGRFLIRVDRRAEDGALVLSFIDDGPGIPNEIRDRVFESFRSHGKAEGTGLGLAIVRKVVEDHGGSIELESQPGHTEFTIVLPQQGYESGESSSETSPSA